MKRQNTMSKRKTGTRKKGDYDARWGVKRSTRKGTKGQFVKGVSGNPGGRMGYRAKAERMLEEEAKDSDVKVILRKLINQAKLGKPWAIEMLLKRLLPPTERRENETVEPASLEALEQRLGVLFKQLEEEPEEDEQVPPESAPESESVH